MPVGTDRHPPAAEVGGTDGADPPDGFTLLRSVLALGTRMAGVAELLGFTMRCDEPGRVVAETVTRPQFGNPMGTVHGGIAATLLDSVMACAVLSTLPAGSSYTTVDLHVTYLRPVPLDGVPLVAEGRAVHTGRRIATAEGSLTDGRGRVVATAVTTCAVLGDATPGGPGGPS